MHHTPDNRYTEIHVNCDIPYREGGSPSWKLDLFQPCPMPASARLPAVVLVHGGGWEAGDKANLADWVIKLVRRGYVCVSVNYRLSDEATFPASVADVKCSVRWLRAHADKLGIDPSRVGAMGISAGAHLVCFLGVTDHHPDLDEGPYEDQSSRVRAVVDICGPTTLTNWGGQLPEEKAWYWIQKFIGGMPAEAPELYAKASPINYVDRDAAPFLIIHGRQDGLVPPNQAEQMHAAIKKVEGTSDLRMFEDATHGVFGEKRDEVLTLIVQFLATHLSSQT